VSDPARLRAATILRDGQVCRICGLDCRAIEREYYSAIAEAHAQHARQSKLCAMQAQHIQNGLWLQGELRGIKDRLRALGFVPGQPLVEVDHIIALAEGGRNELGNLRVLCHPCHARVSADLRARLRRLPLKAFKPLRVDRNGRPV
jgi:5-methylcytosine-specific restriction endonuclease McrA